MNNNNNNNMMNSMNSEDLLKTLSQKLNVNQNELKSAAQSGNVNDVLKNLDSNTAGTIQKVLNDKEATAKLLASPEAQVLMNKLMGKD